MRKQYIEYTPDELSLYDIRQAQLPDAPGIETLHAVNVHYIILHCTATRCTTHYRPEDLIRDHEARGFSAAGYHFLVRKNGNICQFRRTDEKGAHCNGHNWNSIGIAYEGGLNQEGQPDDTMTQSQLYSMRLLIRNISYDFPNIVVRGHRDFNPDKACPCFDAKQRFQKCTYEPSFI